MSKLFDFSGRESNEHALQNTWAEFRQQLADGKFKYNEVEKAMHSTFLRVFDDLFQHGHRFLEKTVAETSLQVIIGLAHPEWNGFIWLSQKNPHRQSIK